MKHLIIVLIAVFSIAGCKRDVVIQDYSDQPIASHGDGGPTMEQIEQTIAIVGASRGWIMQPVEPGHMVGTLDVRGKHRAVIDITFDKQAYSIAYRESENLRFQPPNLIHRNYNRWVVNLARGIDAGLAQAR